nr:immunoglobulin heavy chain junction region [Macaca mulatta]
CARRRTRSSEITSGQIGLDSW